MAMLVSMLNFWGVLKNLIASTDILHDMTSYVHKLHNLSLKHLLKETLQLGDGF